MARITTQKLATYSIEPDLFGGYIVNCSLTSLSGNYENEAHFLHECQKRDWPVFISACNKAVNAAMSVYKAGLFARNAEAQRVIVNRCNNDIPRLTTMNPVEQAKCIQYMIDMLPLFARNEGRNYYGTYITQAIAIVSAYFDRYLARYATYNNSYLTA